MDQKILQAMSGNRRKGRYQIMTPEQVGNKISETRKSLGMTQKDLAEKLNVTDKAVSKWERGLNFPDIALFDDLARTLGLSVIELLCLEDKSGEEIVQTMSEISQEEKMDICKQMKQRAWISIFGGIILYAALLYASYLFLQNGIYGRAMMVTSGMVGFASLEVTNAIYTLIHVGKLKK